MSAADHNAARTSARKASRVAEFERRLAEVQANIDPIRNSNTGSSYDGAELRPFDGRPGAMDAYALPSLGLST